MSVRATFLARLQDVLQRQQFSQFPQSSSSLGSRAIRTLAAIAACLLVLSSAGFGCTFAWQTGAAQGPVLASLSIIMALGLELTKPLAVAGAFNAFRRLALIRGLGLVLLAAVAILYSLSAEISLWAASRGDVVAARLAVIEQAAAHRTRIEAAQREIEQLSAATSTRWRAERARELQGVVAEATTALSKVEAVKAPDPASAAAEVYLKALGVTVPAAAISEWLILLPVVAVEVGSALAGLLVQPISRSERRPAAVPVVQSDDSGSSATEQAADRVLDHVRREGGVLKKSERGLAASIGAPKTTVRRALHLLATAGLIAIEAGRNGSVLRLIA